MISLPLPGTPFSECVPNSESLWCCVIVKPGVSLWCFFFPARTVHDLLNLFWREREREHLVTMILEYIATTLGNGVAVESRSTTIGRMGMWNLTPLPASLPCPSPPPSDRVTHVSWLAWPSISILRTSVQATANEKRPTEANDLATIARARSQTREGGISHTDARDRARLIWRRRTM